MNFFTGLFILHALTQESLSDHHTLAQQFNLPELEVLRFLNRLSSAGLIVSRLVRDDYGLTSPFYPGELNSWEHIISRLR